MILLNTVRPSMRCWQRNRAGVYGDAAASVAIVSGADAFAVTVTAATRGM